MIKLVNKSIVLGAKHSPGMLFPKLPITLICLFYTPALLLSVVIALFVELCLIISIMYNTNNRGHGGHL